MAEALRDGVADGGEASELVEMLADGASFAPDGQETYSARVSFWPRRTVLYRRSMGAGAKDPPWKFERSP